MGFKVSMGYNVIFSKYEIGPLGIISIYIIIKLIILIWIYYNLNHISQAMQ